MKALPTLPFSRGRGGTGWKGWRGGEKPVPGAAPKAPGGPQVSGAGLGKRQGGKITRPATSGPKQAGAGHTGSTESSTTKRQRQRLGDGRRENKSAPSPASGPCKPWSGHLAFPLSPFRILSWWRASCRCRLRTSLRALQQRKRDGGSSGTSSTAHRLVDLRSGSCSP